MSRRTHAAGFFRSLKLRTVKFPFKCTSLLTPFFLGCGVCWFLLKFSCFGFLAGLECWSMNLVEHDVRGRPSNIL